MQFNFKTSSFVEKEVNPNKLAVIGSDRNLSWLQLEQEVSLFIAELKALQLPKGYPVIIYGHKEVGFVVAMLACITLDLPYVPIDVVYPLGRVEEIKSETGSDVVINFSTLSLPSFSVEIDKNFKVKNQLYTAQNGHKVPCYKSDPLRYIIFTSGTTGRPKGVMINKSATENFFDWLLGDYGFCSTDVFLNQALFSFDVSLYDFYGALGLGGTLFLLDKETAGNPHLLFSKIEQYGCTVWTSTPSFIYLFVREKGFEQGDLPSIKSFLFAGEPLPPSTVAQLKNKFPQARVLNAYGPTEATVTTTLVEITEDILKKYDALPIGYVKPGANIFVEEEEKIGGSGELIISGSHVSAGYLNNEKLTKEKFIDIEGQKAFKTGDLGYFKDGLLFCLGRNDSQVKFHGYRIELSEISKKIEGIEGIETAVILTLKRKQEVKRLVAFVLIDEVFTESEKGLQQFVQESLAHVLPYYMIPSSIKKVKEIPLNPNGKVDEDELLKLR